MVKLFPISLLKKLPNCLKRLRSSIWSVAEWSVYFQTTHTNNDIEGWHNRLNHSVRHVQLNLYHLISLLHDEARLVDIQVKLVSEGRIRQDHRRRYANLQSRTFRYWGELLPEKGMPQACWEHAPVLMDHKCRQCRLHENKCCIIM